MYCIVLYNDTLKSVDKALSNEMQFVQFILLRTISGRVRKSTSRHLLLRELGCQPLFCRWFQSMVGLWNRVAQHNQAEGVEGSTQQNRSHGSYCSLLKAAMRDNWQQARDLPPDGRRNLWSQFEGFLGTIQQSFTSLSLLSESLSQQQTHLTEALTNV